MPDEALPLPAPAPRALVGWRLLSMVYDALPVVALWMLASTAFTFGYTFLGHHPARDNIAPFSAPRWANPGHAPVATAAGRFDGHCPEHCRIVATLCDVHAVDPAGRAGILVGVDRPRPAYLARPDQPDADAALAQAE